MIKHLKCHIFNISVCIGLLLFPGLTEYASASSSFSVEPQPRITQEMNVPSPGDQELSRVSPDPLEKMFSAETASMFILSHPLHNVSELSQSLQPTAALKRAAPLGSAAVVAHVDPATGDLTTQSIQLKSQVISISPELQQALSTSSEGLQEVKSPVPGGGYLINLQGRFQNTVIVTINSDGSLKQKCVSSPEEFSHALQLPKVESAEANQQAIRKEGNQ